MGLLVKREYNVFLSEMKFKISFLFIRIYAMCRMPGDFMSILHILFLWPFPVRNVIRTRIRFSTVTGVWIFETQD
jgi:hypothetical protein